MASKLKKIGIKTLLNARGDNIMLHTKWLTKTCNGAGCSGGMQLLSFTWEYDSEEYAMGPNPQAMQDLC